MHAAFAHKSLSPFDTCYCDRTPAYNPPTTATRDEHDRRLLRTNANDFAAKETPLPCTSAIHVPHIHSTSGVEVWMAPPPFGNRQLCQPHAISRRNVAPTCSWMLINPNGYPNLLPTISHKCQLRPASNRRRMLTNAEAANEDHYTSVAYVYYILPTTQCFRAPMHHLTTLPKSGAPSKPTSSEIPSLLTSFLSSLPQRGDHERAP